jgi:transcriptional regulator with XRE-family HTH domain
MSSATARTFKRLREERGWSEEEVAHRVGVDAATVRGWEGGGAEPEPAAMDRIADAFGVSQDALRHAEDARHHPAGGA